MTHPFIYPHDLKGYGAHPPHPQWPGDARIAVQCVINYGVGASISPATGSGSIPLEIKSPLLPGDRCCSFAVRVPPSELA